MKKQVLEHVGRTFAYTDHPLSLPKNITEQVLCILKKWQDTFPAEDTYAQREFGVPSIMARFDGVLSPEGQFEAYEIQSGCGWIGYAGLVNPVFRDIRDDLIKHRWPPFKLLVSPELAPFHPDDTFWAEQISLDDAIDSNNLLWIRYSPQLLDYTVYDKLTARSLKAVRNHGSKYYGTQLGWWKPVLWHESNHGSGLPWDEAFVLKPQYGFGSRDIMLWKPNDRVGRATRTQIVQTLQKNSSMYLQKFIPPMRTQIGDSEYNVIFRPFFGYDPQKKAWIPMHGVWTGRPYPNIRIHGASDAITGPLYLET